ncbi:hypothetical protein BGX29_006759 [Mortierella sp. GBA35]|nr:hypothetical protein BGX29_006759 [Mortierella sp. GBA35]
MYYSDGIELYHQQQQQQEQQQDQRLIDQDDYPARTTATKTGATATTLIARPAWMTVTSDPIPNCSSYPGFEGHPIAFPPLACLTQLELSHGFYDFVFAHYVESSASSRLSGISDRLALREFATKGMMRLSPETDNDSTALSSTAIDETTRQAGFLNYLARLNMPRIFCGSVRTDVFKGFG